MNRPRDILPHSWSEFLAQLPKGARIVKTYRGRNWLGLPCNTRKVQVIYESPVAPAGRKQGDCELFSLPCRFERVL